MSQERKAQLSPAIKAHCKRYGIKATIGVHHHSTLVVNIKSGKLDFCQNYFDTNAPVHSHRYPHHAPMKREECNAIQVNPYWCHEHFTGKCKDFLVELLHLMNIGNHDRSDIMTDYFDVGWYNSVNIGTWQKPYQLVK